MEARALVVLVAALAFVPVAWAAEEPRIHVPLPRDADVGRYELTTEGGDVIPVTFAWQHETFSDAWGRDVDGARVSFDTLGGGSRCSFTFTLPTGGEAESSTTALDRFLRYAPGDARAVAYGGELSYCIAGLLFDSGGPSTGTSGTMRVRYGDAPTFACLFRHGLQGGDVHAAREVDGACGEGAWSAGELRDEGTLRILPIERGDVRFWLADGLAYPYRMEVAATGDFESFALTLVGLATEGAPLPTEPAPAPPPTLATSAPDPLLGPDDADARLPVRLSDAARAAVEDPTLAALQALLADDEAALAGAVMRLETFAGQPAPQPTWSLAFSAPDAAPVGVACRGVSALVPGAPGLVRCTSEEVDDSIGPLPSDFGASSIPAATVGFREALARLEAHDPNATGRALTHAAYRPWSAEDFPASIEIGNVATRSVGSVDLNPADEGTVVAIDLATGRSLVDLTPVATPLVVSDLPEGFEAAGIVGGSSPEGDGAAVPELGRSAIAVVAAASIVVLVLAWLAKSTIAAFFTRLVRPKVLDTELRASVHELVQERPGIHASEIIQHFGRGTGAIEYHLDVLVREGFLTCLKTTGFKHYFVAGRFSMGEMRALAALRQGKAETLYRIIEANPGIHMQALAEQAGLSAGYVSKEIKRLNEAGLVDQVKVGRAVRLHALDK